MASVVIQLYLLGIDMEWQNTKIKKPYYGQVVILKIDGATQDVTFVFDGADDTCDWFEPYNFNEPEHGVFDDLKHELEWVPLPK